MQNRNSEFQILNLKKMIAGFGFFARARSFDNRQRKYGAQSAAIDFRAANQGSDWASAANETFKKLISAGEHDKLIKYENLGDEIAPARADRRTFPAAALRIGAGKRKASRSKFLTTRLIWVRFR